MGRVLQVRPMRGALACCRGSATWPRQANVFRLQVGMDEPALAQEVEGCAQLGSDAPRHVHPHAGGPLRAQLAQGCQQVAAQELRHQAKVPLVLANRNCPHAELVLRVAPAQDLQLLALHDRVEAVPVAATHNLYCHRRLGRSVPRLDAHAKRAPPDLAQHSELARNAPPLGRHLRHEHLAVAVQEQRVRVRGNGVRAQRAVEEPARLGAAACLVFAAALAVCARAQPLHTLAARDGPPAQALVEERARELAQRGPVGRGDRGQRHC